MKTCTACGQPIPDTEIRTWKHGESRVFQRPYTTRQGHTGVARVSVYLSTEQCGQERNFWFGAEIKERRVGGGMTDPLDIDSVLRAWDDELAKDPHL